MWNGAFGPVRAQLVKHHLGTGDIANHLEVVSVDKIDQAPDDNINRKTVGTGEYQFLVAVDFIDGEGGPYEFIFESGDPFPADDEIISEVASYFT